MLEEARQSGAPNRSLLASTALAPLILVFGGRTRFIVGALLLAAFGLWWQQNGSLEAAQQAAQGNTIASEPLKIPMVPAAVLALPSGVPAGVAGVILVITSVFRGGMTAFLAVAAAFITLMGKTLGLPDHGPLGGETLAMVIGAAPGFRAILLRKK